MRSTDRREALLGDIVDDVAPPEALTVGELVMDEIQRPARIGPCLDQERRSRSDRLAPGLPFAHCQAFLAVEPIDPVNPRGLALAAQQHEKPPVAEPTTFVGQFAQPIAQHHFRRTLRFVADHLAIRAGTPARPPF